ncbi:MAG: crotonase/enoyl-CoA hydratase family protein [Maritimibacter sp.]
MTERVTIDIQDHIATVTMNRPSKMNALDSTQIEAIVAAGQSLKQAKGVRAVVLTGAGGAFCAGLDTSTMPELAKAANTTGFTGRTHGDSNLFQASAMVWAELPMPVIAAVEGFAFGGGFQIMLGADMRIAAPGTKFAIMEAKWGLVPDMGGMVLARKLMRGDVLRQLTYTAEIFESDAALTYGAITEIAPDPLARAQDLARAIAARSPDATRSAKALITETEFASTPDVLIAESAAQQALIGQPNQIEAVMAGLEKRTPNFTD